MATTNPIYKYEDNCFQYTVTLPLNHKKIKKLEKITKFVLDWQEQINHKKKMIEEKLTKTIQRLLLMCFVLKKVKVYPAYVSKYNSKRESKLFFNDPR